MKCITLLIFYHLHKSSSPIRNLINSSCTKMKEKKIKNEPKLISSVILYFKINFVSCYGYVNYEEIFHFKELFNISYHSQDYI